MRKKTLAFNIGAIAALTSSAVLAQGVSNFALEEVVVTAQKREQNLQDIPVSAQAFNSEDIRVMGADSVAELMFAAPSLNAGGLGGSQQQMGIRGIIDYSRNPGVDPRMGIYIDEVYQGQGYSADQPLLGLANVEILRGPQGTLFGKNTVSGAINLVTKRPTQEFEGEVALTYGNEGQMKTQAYVSGGLSEDLAGSLSISYDERAGLYENTNLNKDVGDYSRISARGKLHWAATEALDFTLSADFTNRESTEPAGSQLALGHLVTADSGSEDEIEFWGLALKTTYEIDGGYELVSISSYRDTEYQFAGDDDMLSAFLQTTNFDESNTQTTQEFRIQSPEDGNFTWLAGIYYFDSERSTDRSVDLGAAVFAGALGANAALAAGTAFAPSTVENTSYAAFFHSDWTLSDNLSMTLGVRYNEDEKDANWQQYNINESGAAGFQVFPGAAFNFFTKEPQNFTHKENSTSPTVALNYTFDNGTLLYGRYSKAAKAGGFNADFLLRTGEEQFAFFEHDQETVDSYEVGLKTTFMEETVRLNAAAFQMNFEDFQVFAFLPNTGSRTGDSPELVNAAEVTVEGLEVELTWVPMDNLRIFANATMLDAKYDSFDLAGQNITADYTGNPLPYAPDLKYFISAQYIAQLGEGSLTFDIDYTSVDEQFSVPNAYEEASAEDPTLINRIPDYSLVNARVAYTPAAGNWEFALWGRNLADKEYRKTNSQNFLGFDRTLWGDPRMFGLTFTYFMGQ